VSVVRNFSSNSNSNSSTSGSSSVGCKKLFLRTCAHKTVNSNNILCKHSICVNIFENVEKAQIHKLIPNRGSRHNPHKGTEG